MTETMNNTHAHAAVGPYLAEIVAKLAADTANSEPYFLKAFTQSNEEQGFC